MDTPASFCGSCTNLNQQETKMNPPKEKPVFYINSSALSVKSTCSLRLRYTICDGYNQDIGRYPDVFFGTCFHLYVQTLAQTKGNHTEALSKALTLWTKKQNILIPRDRKDYINAMFLAQTIQQYYATYSKSGNPEWWDNIEHFHYYRNPDGVPFVEQKIILPYFRSPLFDLIVVGTIDALGWIGQALCLLDFKTTSNYDPEKYFSKYEVSNQMLLYTWMLRYLANNYPDSYFGEIFRKHPGFGCAIFGIFHKKGEVNFKRSNIIFFPERQMQAFENALTIKLQQILQICNNYVNNPKLKHYEGLVNGTCKMYGAAECPYVCGCTAMKAEDEEVIIEAKYGKTPYNPLETHEDV